MPANPSPENRKTPQIKSDPKRDSPVGRPRECRNCLPFARNGQKNPDPDGTFWHPPRLPKKTSATGQRTK